MDLYLDQNYEEAFKLFQKTAHLGHGKSQFNLGVQYLRGQGVDADPIYAYAYFSSAIDNDFNKAQQAQKTVRRRLSTKQLALAESKAKEVIELYGKNGSENISVSLSFGRTYNPPPKRLENPEANYPERLLKQGIPGIAKYVFDIDRNGTVRDLQLIQSYPAAEFALSVEEKLQNSRYQVLEVDGTRRKFSQARFSGVFKRVDIPLETRTQLENKQQQLTELAQNDNLKAQAELADLLELMHDHEQPQIAYLNSETATPSNAEARLISTQSEPFELTAQLPLNFYNLRYLVWLNKQGQTIRHQTYGAYKAPNRLNELALSTMQSWQVTITGKEQAEYGPFLAEFYFNNEKQTNYHANHLNREKVRLKKIITKDKEELPNYWRVKAAQGGDAASLMLLGSSCNLKILGVAAELNYAPAQTLAAKCILQNSRLNSADQLTAKKWLQSAASQQDLIAMRLLAGVYVQGLFNQTELNEAIALTTRVVEQTDDPLAYEYMAAAYAKLGQFDRAIEIQEQAIEEADEQGYYIDFAKNRLAAYENSQVASW
jgi:TPR repeat protein